MTAKTFASPANNMVGQFFGLLLLAHAATSFIFGYFAFLNKFVVGGIWALICESVLISLAWILILREDHNWKNQLPKYTAIVIPVLITLAFVLGIDPISRWQTWFGPVIVYDRLFMFSQIFGPRQSAFQYCLGIAVLIGFIGFWLRNEMPRTALTMVGILFLSGGAWFFMDGIDIYAKGFSLLCAKSGLPHENCPDLVYATISSYRTLSVGLAGIGIFGIIIGLFKPKLMRWKSRTART